jgi:hypothetical protein
MGVNGLLMETHPTVVAVIGTATCQDGVMRCIRGVVQLAECIEYSRDHA